MMRQTQQAPSNVVITVDAEIGVRERRLAKLHDIRRLAVELDQARLPAAAAPRPPAASPTPKPRNSKRQSPLEITEILDVARDVLGDGPAGMARILEAAGRTRSPHAVRVTEAALEQLGAVAVGKIRGGVTAYALPTDNEDEPAGTTVEDNMPDALRDAIADLARTAVGWDDEEFQYQLRKRCRIEASLTDVHKARLALNGVAGVRR